MSKCECKECLHESVCLYKPCVGECPLYKYKSLFVELPCEAEKCIYCHEDSEGYSSAFGAFWLSYSVHEGWLLHAGKRKPKPISYCPICGRKLKELERRDEKAN